MKIIPLSEGSFTVDKTKEFSPFDESNHQLKERPAGSLLVEVQPFVVITSQDILLLDTGLGFETNGVLQLHKNLMDAGINPSEVTKVLLSHLHKDHAGGIGTEREGLGARLSFPNANYYVQREEFEYAMGKGSASYVMKDLVSLKDNEKVILLDGDGPINDQIECKVTKAHSPFHQVFWIKEDNETIFFGADDAPQLYQMKHKFAAKYDFDGKKAMQLRQEWWEMGEKEGWKFLFYHDITTPLFSF